MRVGLIAKHGEPFVLHHLDIAAMHLVDFLVHGIGELVRARHNVYLRRVARPPLNAPCRLAPLVCLLLILNRALRTLSAPCRLLSSLPLPPPSCRNKPIPHTPPVP